MGGWEGGRLPNPDPTRIQSRNDPDPTRIPKAQLPGRSSPTKWAWIGGRQKPQNALHDPRTKIQVPLRGRLLRSNCGLLRGCELYAKRFAVEINLSCQICLPSILSIVELIHILGNNQAFPRQHGFQVATLESPLEGFSLLFSKSSPPVPVTSLNSPSMNACGYFF